MFRLLVIFLFFFVYSCSSFNTEPKYTIRAFDEDSPKILLMPIDIEICELTLAGMCEPKASWTNESRENIITSFKEILDKRNASLNEYNKNSTNEDVNQLIKLHTQIGQEIINNEYGPFKLPTKNEFDWSIGKEAQILREHTKQLTKFTLPGPMTITDTIANDFYLSLIHIRRCRRIESCRSRRSPYH